VTALHASCCTPFHRSSHHPLLASVLPLHVQLIPALIALQTHPVIGETILQLLDRRQPTSLLTTDRGSPACQMKAVAGQPRQGAAADGMAPLRLRVVIGSLQQAAFPFLTTVAVALRQALARAPGRRVAVELVAAPLLPQDWAQLLVRNMEASLRESLQTGGLKRGAVSVSVRLDACPVVTSPHEPPVDVTLSAAACNGHGWPLAASLTDVLEDTDWSCESLGSSPQFPSLLSTRVDLARALEDAVAAAASRLP